MAEISEWKESKAETSSHKNFRRATYLRKEASFREKSKRKKGKEDQKPSS